MSEQKLSTLNLNTTVANGSYIRQDLVEQREADLLKQLEIAEDTVDVLEQLLQKYGAEILRLRAYNDALRLTQNPVPHYVGIPAQHLWVWPHHQSPSLPIQDMNKVWCQADAKIKVENIDQFLSDLGIASEIVDSWPAWKKAGML